MSDLRTIRFDELGKNKFAGVIAVVDIDFQDDDLWTAHSVKVLEYWADDSHVCREDRPDWFAFLDQVVARWLADKNLCNMQTETCAA